MITLIQHTVWVVATEMGFDAIDYKGNVIASNKFKSTLEMIVRTEHVERLGIVAIAPVIVPSNRQPKRKLPKRSRAVWARKHYDKP